MAAKLSLRLLLTFILAVAVTSTPTPGRVPKVYNALITSNQNLEPSKSYPVYNPVLHDPFGFSVHPSVLYGGVPFENGPPQAPVPKKPEDTPQAPAAPEATPAEPAPVPEEPPKEPSEAVTPAPPDSLPPPPSTQSPIPLNEFGLPSQVLPLGRFNPAYNGFTQVGGFPYPYPGVRYYNPYDPFPLGYGFPLYRPLPNVLELGGYRPSVNLVPPQVPVATPSNPPAESPPAEPSDLNLLNYSSKDPAIPNVPPPPLPQGGLKSDSE